MSTYRGIKWVKEGLLPYPKHGSCVHYEPAVLQKSKKTLNRDSESGSIVRGNFSQLARSYIIRDGTKKDSAWYCEACGMTVKDKYRKKIEQIVEYLNQGGDNDQKLCRLFRGVEIGEVMQPSPGKIFLKCGAGCGKDYVPPKNIYQ